MSPVLLVVGWLVWDALCIGLFAHPDVVAEYHFGAEAMIGNGGWGYRSRLAYLLSGLSKATLICAGIGLFAWILRRRSRRRLVSPSLDSDD